MLFLSESLLWHDIQSVPETLHVGPGNQANTTRIAPSTELLLLYSVLNICSQLETSQTEKGVLSIIVWYFQELYMPPGIKASHLVTGENGCQSGDSYLRGTCCILAY